MAKVSKVRGRKGKLGKKKGWIAAYYASSRNLFNKARRLVKHKRRYGLTDTMANEALRVTVAAMPYATSKRFNFTYGE